MAAPTEKLFEEIDEKFNVTLKQKQRKAITVLFNGKDVFVGTKTGIGKSMTYEYAPVLFENGTTVNFNNVNEWSKFHVWKKLRF